MLNKHWNIIAEDPESGEDEESDTAGGDDAEASARDPEQSSSESDEAEELSSVHLWETRGPPEQGQRRARRRDPYDPSGRYKSFYVLVSLSFFVSPTSHSEEDLPLQ